MHGEVLDGVPRFLRGQCGSEGVERASPLTLDEPTLSIGMENFDQPPGKLVMWPTLGTEWPLSLLYVMRSYTLGSNERHATVNSDYERLRKNLSRLDNSPNLLERLDDWHHRTGCPGSWVFCDMWDAYTTHEYRSVIYTRLWALKCQAKAYASVFLLRKKAK